MINFSQETKICDMMIAVDEPLFWHYQGNTKKLVEMIKKIHVEKWNEIYSRAGAQLFIFMMINLCRDVEEIIYLLEISRLKSILEFIAMLGCL